MGNPKGIQRNFEKLQDRRFLAARLLQQGVPQAEVARRVGVHRQSVGRWAQQLAEGGRRALKKAGRAGRKPRLKTADLRRIEHGLKRGPQALGYGTDLWTSERVAHLIEAECGVRYHPSQAWRILRQLGWSCQRPVGRALERDEAKIRRWNKKRWPEIKKKPEKKGRTIVFIDESGLSERPHRCRTWAPKGRTPVLQYHFNWKTLVGDGRRDLVELLFPVVSGSDPQPADHRVSLAPAAPYSGQAADCLGRIAGPSQPSGVGFRAAAETDASGWSFFPPMLRN